MAACASASRSLRRGAVVGAALALLAWAAAAHAASTPPTARPAPRIVSLNPCLDAILLDVADPSQIAALSHWSADPASFAMAERARGFRHVSDDAETVAALRPDLVLVGGAASRPLADVLSRLGIASAAFQVPETVAASEAQVRRVAALAGHPARGEALVARIEAALQAAAPAPGEIPLSAVVFEDRGMVSGPHTLMDELMARAGLRNAAPRYGLARTGELSLERLAADPPRVLLSGRLAPGEPDWADRVLSHPALASLRPRLRRESFPQPLMFCAGPVLIPAAAALARARRDAERAP